LAVVGKFDLPANCSNPHWLIYRSRVCDYPTNPKFDWLYPTQCGCYPWFGDRVFQADLQTGTFRIQSSSIWSDLYHRPDSSCSATYAWASRQFAQLICRAGCRDNRLVFVCFVDLLFFISRDPAGLCPIKHCGYSGLFQWCAPPGKWVADYLELVPAWSIDHYFVGYFVLYHIDEHIRSSLCHWHCHIGGVSAICAIPWTFSLMDSDDHR